MNPVILKIIFWLSIGLVAYAYFGYPLVLRMLSPVLGFKPRRDESYTPTVSLLILAYNEEKSIAARLENALELDYPRDKLEIIVVSNGSTDRTDEIVRSYAGRGVKLLSYKEPGKTRAQNLAVPHAKGWIVVFSDANSSYRKDAIRKLVRNFADSRVGLVCGRSSYTVSSENAVGRGEGLYWEYDAILKLLESRLGACLVADGSIFAFRKKLYEPIDENLTEDFVLPIRILNKGYRNLFEPEAVATEKAVEKGREGFAIKSRIIVQGSRAFFSVLSEVSLRRLLVIFEMVSHKLLRWLAGIPLTAALVSNVFLLQDKWYFALFVLQVAFYLCAVLGILLEKAGVKMKVLFIPYYFCLVNAAALTGVVKMLFGAKAPTWQKAESTR